jgi:phosphinothricin acetyltransferase
MTAALAVRPARRVDLASLASLYNFYVTHSTATFDTTPCSVDDRAGWFEVFAGAGPHRLLVAADGDAVHGYASSAPYRSHPAFGETVEFSVYVAPSATGGGVGSLLYGALIEALSSERVHLAVAGIALPNDASAALHRKFGFTEVGIFQDYAVKNGTYISSLWMQRRLQACVDLPAV